VRDERLEQVRAHVHPLQHRLHDPLPCLPQP
jgi:hypothetical protein